MRHEQVAIHRRNRNLVLAAGWLLVLAGYFSYEAIVVAAGALVLNGYAWFLMRADKRLAKKKSWRIPEASLLLAAFLGGGPGALAGMLIHRHKTRHASFLFWVPLFCMLQIALVVWIGRQ
ncbi:DUF1294 domain-containing protein [Brevibacillus agri]|uniref:DUF1294 domain-containing protein n=1 Tax=Brevibacillus agri TaxID=51101 RepID=UPI001EE5A3FD|nr:DUF1294 domain-containing protein [Brevibacillus agri]MCG5252529.1 DUF1294 domain-containing protein [Brevibacillus agri]MED1642746.1 DUF1294 domain-containing protein [Brevibacillus agri]MED1656703.1 DUF1294 domain-containing protein [Brevibacillus agri]MED1687641.1 DUF1294 domain-containing protein [Brevibacillus agri]MED1694221.1 DUF1294 domain-containing protein [Brevibacillus agri]